MSRRLLRNHAAQAFLTIVACFAVSAPTASAANQPAMHFDSHMQVVPVCFSVTNPAGGQSALFGLRYTDSNGPVAPTTPAIVLVHGIASSTEDWDFSPSWSAARALAAAGYVVFSYDRLGYAASSYFDHPGGGYTLTTQAARDELHQLVGEVKSGGYTTTSGADCSGAQTPSTLSNHTVVIVGHSAGGWIVAGYPGEYHDVAAMIQNDISGSAGGGATSPLGSSSGGSFTADPQHPDYFQFFQTSQDCNEFNIYPPGEVAYVVQIACAPPFLDSPFGEIADIPAMYAQNDAYISMIGPSIPVLLSAGDHDTTDPPSSADADYAYYKAHCGCDVTQLMLPNTGHLFMAHRSLPQWIDSVVSWLSAKGVPPAKP